MLTSQIKSQFAVWSAFASCVIIGFVRPAAAQLSGTIQASGLPAANARVTLFDDSLATFREIRSSASGTYQFSPAPAGVYHLGVAQPGKAYAQVDVTLGTVSVQQDVSLVAETNPGQWNIIGNTLGETFDASDIGIILTDGRIMYCHDTLTPVIFNPTNGQSVQGSSSGLAQGCMNITLLPDGRPIFVGGQPGSDPGQFTNAVRYVKAYNPSANSWQRLTDLQAPTGRWYPGMVRFADGSMMVMGGGTCCQAVRTATCERLNLTTLTWSFTGSMLNPSEYTPTALLYTGEVLATWWPPQLYNPVSGTWRATGNFNQTDRGWPNHSDHSLVILSDGRALAIGIRRTGTGPATMGEIYNPATGTWSLTTNPTLPRYQSEVVQLPDGKVLAAAGEAPGDPSPIPNVLGVVKWSDLFDSSTNTWRRVADMNQFREYHAVTLLVADGRVLTTGGTIIQFSNPANSADVEAFSPPYLFRGVRPQITSVTSTRLPRGGAVSLGIFPATRLTSMVLIGTGATTHWVDAGVQRRLVLPVTQSGSVATASLPLDPNVLPAGQYFLFGMVDDIPSIGRIVQVLPRCWADFNGTGGISVQDIFDFLAAWFAGDAATDINAVDGITVQDIFDFLGAWFAGCP